MTVEELIKVLEGLPKGTLAACVYSCCSEYVLLEPKDITFHEVGIKDPCSTKTKRYVLRHGKIMEYDENTWDKTEIPNFVSVVAFPGN